MNKRKYAVLVYIMVDRKVLMIYGAQSYAPHYQLYNGLGGKIESDETHEQAVHREVQQEAGIEIQGELDYVGELRFIGLRTLDNDWTVYTYRAYDYMGTPTPNDREGHIKWFSIDKVSQIPTQPGDQEFLPLIFAGKHFDAIVQYDGIELVSCQPVFRD